MNKWLLRSLYDVPLRDRLARILYVLLWICMIALLAVTLAPRLSAREHGAPSGQENNRGESLRKELAPGSQNVIGEAGREVGPSLPLSPGYQPPLDVPFRPSVLSTGRCDLQVVRYESSVLSTGQLELRLVIEGTP